VKLGDGQLNTAGEPTTTTRYCSSADGTKLSSLGNIAFSSSGSASLLSGTADLGGTAARLQHASRKPPTSKPNAG